VITTGLRTPGYYNNIVGDIATALAARTYDLHIHIITENGTSYTLNRRSPHTITLARLPAPINGTDRWLATSEREWWKLW
jgi:hypothetical protein